MTDLHHARRAIDAIAADRRARGAHIPPDHVEAAAALLADLWAVAIRHGIRSDQPGYDLHIPRAALDTISAARKQHPSQPGRPALPTRA
jgi:hypothetical protein